MKTPQPYTAATRPIFVNVPTLRTAKKRLEDAKLLPPIKKLIGNIWHTNELVLLFGDTGSGKSLFGIQCANAISKGISAIPLLENENPPIPVLYYDFELSDRQFLQRYSDANGNVHQFAENCIIDNLNFGAMMGENINIPFVQLLQEKICEDVEALKEAYKTESLVLFVDNLSYLHTQTTVDPQASLEIMKFLLSLKNEHDVSVCVLSHTPKVAGNIPLTLNHLAGSKHLSNFADAVFCVGKSAKSEDLRYIKQLKCRNAEIIYNSQEVLTVRLESADTFKRFIFEGINSEFDHLDISEATAADNRKLTAIELHHSGKTLQEIADLLQVGKTTIHRWLKNSGNEN